MRFKCPEKLGGHTPWFYLLTLNVLISQNERDNGCFFKQMQPDHTILFCTPHLAAFPSYCAASVRRPEAPMYSTFPPRPVLLKIQREVPFSLLAPASKALQHDFRTYRSDTDAGEEKEEREEREEVNRWERRAKESQRRRRKEEEKFSLDLKTNNDSSYNRNKLSERCQTQGVQKKETLPQKKKKKKRGAALLIFGKVVTTTDYGLSFDRRRGRRRSGAQVAPFRCLEMNLI